jgi:hypothetical protein
MVGKSGLDFLKEFVELSSQSSVFFDLSWRSCRQSQRNGSNEFRDEILNGKRLSRASPPGTGQGLSLIAVLFAHSHPSCAPRQAVLPHAAGTPR